MSNGVFRIMKPQNEAVPGYLPGSTEKQGLKAKLAGMKQSTLEIPMIIGGKDFVFAHHSADPGALVTALIGGAYSY